MRLSNPINLTRTLSSSLHQMRRNEQASEHTDKGPHTKTKQKCEAFLTASTGLPGQDKSSQPSSATMAQHPVDDGWRRAPQRPPELVAIALARVPRSTASSEKLSSATTVADAGAEMQQTQFDSRAGQTNKVWEWRSMLGNICCKILQAWRICRRANSWLSQVKIGLRSQRLPSIENYPNFALSPLPNARITRSHLPGTFSLSH